MLIAMAADFSNRLAPGSGDPTNSTLQATIHCVRLKMSLHMMGAPEKSATRYYPCRWMSDRPTPSHSHKSMSIATTADTSHSLAGCLPHCLTCQRHSIVPAVKCPPCLSSLNRLPQGSRDRPAFYHRKMSIHDCRPEKAAARYDTWHWMATPVVQPLKWDKNNRSNRVLNICPGLLPDEPTYYQSELLGQYHHPIFRMNEGDFPNGGHRNQNGGCSTTEIIHKTMNTFFMFYPQWKC